LQTQDVLRGTLQQQNPVQAQELQSINQTYRNYTVLRNAGSKVNDSDMPILPGQLQAAVKAGDKSVGKGNFAKGNANMQDLSDEGMSVLGNKYPDSGAAGRGMLGHVIGTALGVGGAAEHSLAPLLGGAVALSGPAAAYGTNAGRQAMLTLLARRPDLVRSLGGGIQALAPLIGGSAATTQMGR
jgi:hypothetical protein